MSADIRNGQPVRESLSRRSREGQRRGFRTAVMLAAAGVALVGACAHGVGVVRLPGSEEMIAWPPPPEPARIRFLGALSAPGDIGARRSLLRRALSFLTGSVVEQIRQPYGIAVDSAGRVFVADPGIAGVHVFDLAERRHRVVHDPGGHSLEYPVGVAVDDAGVVYVTDAEAASLTAMTAVGEERFRVSDGLLRPAGVSWHPGNGLLYVVDVQAHDVKVYDRAGTLRMTFGGRGGGPGRFNYPTNVAVDDSGSVYVTDSMNFRVQIFTQDGIFLREFGRPGDSPGDLARPKGIGVDSEGHVYVVEGLFDTVNVFDDGGQHLLTFGGPGTMFGEFWLATGLAIDGRDRIYVADSFNGRVQVFQYLPAEN